MVIEKKEEEKYKISMDIKNCCFHSNIIKACDVKGRYKLTRSVVAIFLAFIE